MAGRSKNGSNLLHKSGQKETKSRQIWLKKDNLGSNTAGWLAEGSEGKGAETSDPDAYLAAAEQYVEEMFSGAKAALLPLYAELLRVGLAIGSDVKACPCRTIVPLYRRHVFAQIKPATRTRIDLGFALGGRKAEGRLIETGGFAKKDRITHRNPDLPRAADR